MSEFLTGRELSARIREVLRGKNLKCAVAFWGKETGITKHFKDAKIISDIHNGGTNPSVLKELLKKSKNKKNIRYCENIHAKVYWSSEGVVIGSANASTSGLGTIKGVPSNLEAGVFHKPNVSVWNSVEKWFDEEFQKSHSVDERALQLCEERWSCKEKQGFTREELDKEIEQKMKVAQEKGSLLEMVCADPEAFCKVSFVFTDKQSPVDGKREKEIKYEAVKDRAIKKDELASLLPWDAWKVKEGATIESNLIELFKKGSRLFLVAHKVFYFRKNLKKREFCLLTKAEKWVSWRRNPISPQKIPFIKDIRKQDLNRIENLLTKSKEWNGTILSAYDLKQVLEEVEALG